MFSQPNNRTTFFTRIFFDLCVYSIHRRPFLLWAANAARQKTICLGYFPNRGAEAESKEKLQHIYCIWATLCQSRLNPMAKSTLSSSQGLRIWPLEPREVNIMTRRMNCFCSAP